MTTAEQILEAARTHAAGVIPQIPDWERTGQFPRESLLAAAQAGLLAMYVPTDRGGLGLTPADGAPVMEELGRTDSLYGLTISMNNFANLALAAAPADSVAGDWGRRVCAGEALAAFLLTEEGGGSDALGALTTRAVPDGDGYRLSGKKTWVLIASEADVYTIVCRTGEPSRDAGDTMMVAVPADAPGVRVTRVYDTSSAAYIPVCEVELDDVRLEPGQILAPEGKGLSLALSAIDIARVHVSAACTGMASAALETAMEQSRGRRLFDTDLIDHQSNLFAMTDVATSIHISRLLYQHAASLIGTPDGSLAAAHAKVYCPEAAVESILACSRLLGARGSLRETGLPRLLDGAQMFTMADGAPAVQRMVIGRSLLKNRSAVE